MTHPIEQELRRQIDILDDAIERVKRDVSVNLSRSDFDIKGICARIQKLDKTTGISLEPALLEAINRLDTLELELDSFKRRMTKEI